MIEEQILSNLLNNFGFPVFVTAILLYDKMKTNGELKKVVENNNYVLCEIKEQLLKGGSKK